jgi:uncharacterized integral membrane protein
MIMEDKPNRNLYRLIIAVIILVLVVTFALQNSDGATVNLWFWQTNAPLILLFLMCFIAGLLFALLGLVPVYKHSKRKTKLIEELKERIDILEKQNAGKQ